MEDQKKVSAMAPFLIRKLVVNSDLEYLRM